MPKVKIRMPESGISFGITHNYMNTDYSMFMLHGELIGEGVMSRVKEYLIRTYKELRTAISSDSLSEENF